MATYKEIEPFRQGIRVKGGIATDTLTVAGNSVTSSGPTGPTGPTGGTGPTGPTGPLATYAVVGSITAAGTNQSNGTALTGIINLVTTVASSTGVILPVAATIGVGNKVVIFNSGANPCKVYGNATDSATIDGTAGATGVTLTNAKRCEYYVTTSTTWVSAQLGVVSA